jgi:hypothetical protein
MGNRTHVTEENSPSTGMAHVGGSDLWHVKVQIQMSEGTIDDRFKCRTSTARGGSRQVKA